MTFAVNVRQLLPLRLASFDGADSSGASCATTRAQYLAQCKARALVILMSGDTRGAIAAMLHDIRQWPGGDICDAGELAMREVEAVFYTVDAGQVRDWIEAFS